MRLLVAGAGGHGRVVADLASLGAFADVAFLDDRYPELQRAGDWLVVGKIRDLPGMYRSFDACIAAVGKAALRLRIQTAAEDLGMQVPVLIHPRAIVSARSQLGAGTVVVAGAVINIAVRVGRGCIVNTGATVDHDCVLEDGVHICPGASLAGNVFVGLRSWFGIGAVAKQGIRIGADVTIGAGAVCLRDIDDGVTVAGVPAKEICK